MDIAELRGEIDQIDRKLLTLLAQRLELALEVNRAKQHQRLPLHDAHRESNVIRAAREAASDSLQASEAADFMQSLLQFSRASVKRRMAAEDVSPCRIAILGLGLIGGSLALALKRATPGHSITGVDLPERVHAPRECGVFEAVFPADNGAKAVEDADVVFLCAPPSRNLELLAGVFQDAPTGAIITDVGGLKRDICDRARRLSDVPGPLFIGGHPMAGKAVAGFKHASPSLFEGRPWVLTPDRHTPPDRLRVLHRLIESTGAGVQLLTADEHDRIVPAVSHLPQLCSVALMLTVGGRDHGIAGPALREMTRLAESSPDLWHELLAGCREQAVGEVQRLRTYLTELEVALGLKEPVTGLFERAALLRRQMLKGSVTSLEIGE
jgi:prephenate dehydrogenase